MLPYRAIRRSADNSRSLLCNDTYGFRDVMAMTRLFDLPALQKTCGQRWRWTADKMLSVAQELYDGDGKKLITYPRAEAHYLTENQISDVPAIVAALTRLRGFAQLEIAPLVIRRNKSGHFCDKALESISHHAVVPNISQGPTGLHGNGPRAGTNSDEDAFPISERDIVRAVAKRGTAVFGDASSLHMTTKVTTTSEDEHVHEAMDKMTRGRFRHLPVICYEQLVGLVSIGDLVKYRLAKCEFEHKAMREYIATA